jgi:hypothetical protein
LHYSKVVGVNASIFAWRNKRVAIKLIGSLNLAVPKRDFVPKDSINHAKLGKEVPLSRNQKIKRIWSWNRCYTISKDVGANFQKKLHQTWNSI